MNGFVESWSAVILGITWQLAALAMLALVAEVVFKLRQARIRLALWWFVLLAPLVLTPGRLALQHFDALIRVAPPEPVAKVLVLPSAPMPVSAPIISIEEIVPPVPTSLISEMQLTDWLALIWLAGVVFFGLRLLIGHWRIRQILARSQPIIEEALLAVFSRLLAETKLLKKVELRSSPQVNSPVLYGHWRPKIILPETWLATLTGEEADALLAHEIAHVARRDFLANFAQRLLEALLYFHPAVWLASRRILQAREELCDIWVVKRGCDLLSYVKSLAGAAEKLQATQPSIIAVGLAEYKCSLLKRVEAIIGLDKVKRVSRPVVILLSTAALCFGLIIGGLQFGLKESAAAENSSGEKSSPAIREMGDKLPVHFSGAVVDEQGQPVVGAALWVCAYPAGNYSDVPFMNQALGSTGPDGKFDFEIIPQNKFPDRNWKEQWDYWISAHKSGLGVGWGYLSGGENKHQVKIVLVRGVSFRGKVLDADGKPFAGAPVELESITLPPAGNGRQKESRLILDPFTPAPPWSKSKTNSKGEFVFADLPEDAKVNLSVTTFDTGQTRGQTCPPLEEIKLAEQRGGLTIRLIRMPVIEGVLLLPGQKRAPAVGVEVMGSAQILGKPNSTFGLGGHKQFLTDAEGRYRIECPVLGTYDIWTLDEHYVGIIAEELELKLGAIIKLPPVTLKRSALIKGQVLEAATGKPIPEAWVSCRSYKAVAALFPPRPCYTSTKTNGEGEFVLAAMPGKVLVSASPPQGYTWSHQVSQTGGTDQVNREKSSEQQLQIAPGETKKNVKLFFMPLAELPIDDSGAAPRPKVETIDVKYMTSEECRTLFSAPQEKPKTTFPKNSDSSLLEVGIDIAAPFASLLPAGLVILPEDQSNPQQLIVSGTPEAIGQFRELVKIFDQKPKPVIIEIKSYSGAPNGSDAASWRPVEVAKLTQPCEITAKLGILKGEAVFKSVQSYSRVNGARTITMNNRPAVMGSDMIISTNNRKLGELINVTPRINTDESVTMLLRFRSYLKNPKGTIGDEYAEFEVNTLANFKSDETLALVVSGGPQDLTLLIKYELMEDKTQAK